MRRALIALGVGFAVLGLAAPALAHVTIQPDEALVGDFARFVVRVPTERDDASTIEIQLELPPLAFVSFQDTPGWERSIEMRTLDEPLEVFGEQVTEVVGTVTWEGGEIEPNEFQEFGFSARMPDQETTLEFAAIQTYDSGEVVRWIGPPDSEEPAALVEVLDIGAGEEEGELEVLARLAGGAEAENSPAEDGGNLGVILGWIAIVLAAIALIVSLVRKRA
ncbi:MAG TPA: YcnI family protein [Actinomycetota bacterium]|nr:YcnI family protein [Actinomycetota bacterium]